MMEDLQEADVKNFHQKQEEPLPLTPDELQEYIIPAEVVEGEVENETVPNKDKKLKHSNSTKKKKDDPSDKEYREIAKKLFNEDFVSIKPEEYTQFLAANDEESSKIRNHYMDLFKWNANLLTSTRMLCSKLYLKGESQEIDRILSSFTKSYIKQHPTNVFCTRNFEKIYIVIYSLILLNTALHNSELSKKSKINQADYIKNTFTTFINQNPKSSKNLLIKQRIIIERELSNYYESLLKNELHLKQSDETEESTKRYSRISGNSDYKKELPVHDYPTQQATSNASDNSDKTITSEYPAATQENTDNDNGLARQVSSSSIWSTDTADNRRASLVMKRMSSTTSAVTQYTALNNPSNARVGFGRALALGGGNKRLYSNPNGSKISAVSSLNPRQSLDYLKTANSNPQHPLNKRSSRSSIISKDSTNSYADDISVLSFDTTNLNNLQIDDGQANPNDAYQQLEDFNVNDYQDHYDLTLELQGSPYLKEGLLKLKIINNDLLDNAATQDVSSSNVSANSSASTGSRFLSFFTRTPSNSSNSSVQRSNTSLGTQTSMINKFTENFVVVSKGELALYSFDPKVIKKHQQKLKKINKNTVDVQEEVDSEIGDGNWLKNAANIGNYNLCSTFAQLERPAAISNSTKKIILWSLNFPKVNKKQPKKFIFEAGTKEIALEFINTCNFWAAKITAIPTLEESISSIEYGWTNLDGLISNRDQFKKLKYISKWESLVKGVYLSNYIVASEFDGEANHSGMMKQFVKTYNYYNNLRKLYQEFLNLQKKFISNFPQKLYGGSNYNKIVNNYEFKIIEYKAELTKYKNYLVILGFGLQLRFDMEDQDKLENRETARKQSIVGVDGIEPNVDESEVMEDTLFEDEDDDLTKLVKSEIRKLFTNMKDISKIIPTFQASKSLNDLAAIANRGSSKEDGFNAIPMVKSPKSYTLTHYTDNESPINQLIQTSEATDGMKYSTCTIKEEEEPEDPEFEKSESETKVESPDLLVTTDSYDPKSPAKRENTLHENVIVQ